MTVAWHVDGLKVLHQNLSANKDFAKLLNDEFGKETPISKSYRKKHEYMGMLLDYSMTGKVTVSTTDYKRLMLQNMPADMTGIAATPAGNSLFKVNNANTTKLTGEKKDIFIHIMMQLLYLSQQVRRDIRTAVFIDNHKKVGRVIKYLRGTIDLPLKLQGDGSGAIKWYVDALYAVHTDMKGHTSGTLSLGRGSIYSKSTKQKLVARSLTESEVNGVHNVLPQAIWMSNFLQDQGVNIKESILFQDNMSSILLEKKSRSSSSKQTRHMNIRFFFMKDRVDS